MAALAALGVAGCEPDPGTVVLLTVDARPQVLGAAAIEVNAENEGDTATTTLSLTSGFPATIVIAAKGRTGDLGLTVNAVDSDGIPRGVGTLNAELVPDQQLDVSVTLDPADFVVNAATEATQKPYFKPGRAGRQIDTGPDGSFSIAFTDDCSTTGRCDIFLRLFDPSGAPKTNDTTGDTTEFTVGLEQLNSSVPSVALGDNTLFVAWETFDDVRGAIFDTNGKHLTPADTVLSADPTLIPVDPDVARLANDEYVIVWSQNNPGGGSEIRGRIVDATGAPVTNQITADAADFPISLDSPAQYKNPNVAATGNGREFVVVWEGQNDIFIGFFDANGVYRSGGGDSAITANPVNIEGVAPHLALNSAGDAVVTWANRDTGMPGAYVAGHFTKPAGAISGELVTLAPAPNTTSSPSVAIVNDVVGLAWHECDETGDGSGCGVFLRLFDSALAPLGERQTANTTVPNDQTDPSIAALPDSSGFVMVWSDGSQRPPDTSEGSVRARLVYPPNMPAPGS